MPDTVPTNPSTDSWENEGGSFIASAHGGTRGTLESPAGPARPVDTSPRACLLDALERVLNGAGLGPREFAAAVTAPENLTPYEHDAWNQLRHWADEADVRASDRNYAAFHLDWLRDLHAKLA